MEWRSRIAKAIDLKCKIFLQAPGFVLPKRRKGEIDSKSTVLRGLHAEN